MTSPEQAAAVAIKQAGDHADEAWLEYAKRSVSRRARDGESFTTDEVWHDLELAGLTTHEPRAMGAVMKWAQGQQLIKATGEYRKSSRVERHARPVMVWAAPTPYPWCYGNPTREACMEAGYCRRDPNCGE